ncbi:hypothetical protein ACFLR1_02385 [Bacteroidota bacterium]
MSDYQNNSELLGIILKWWKQLLKIAAIGFVLSAIVSSSYVITPKFKSYGVLYPANIISMGTESPTEQMLQVLESAAIRDSIIKKYDLYNHYDIDPEELYSRSDLIKEFEKNITFRKTEYESVVVEVLDKDPVQARDIVNSIIALFNRKERIMQKEKAIEQVTVLNKQLVFKKAEMDSMENILSGIRKDYGILDYTLQTEYVTERYLQVISSPGGEQRAKELTPIMNALKEKGGEFLALNEHLLRIRENYNDTKEEMEEAKRDVDKVLTYCNIISYPEVPDKKAYPLRWLIIGLSTVGTFLFGLVALSLMENFRRINKPQ